MYYTLETRRDSALFDIQVYSRNLENSTEKFPDIVESFRSFLKDGVASIVLDGEVVAYDQDENKILPFQACFS